VKAKGVAIGAGVVIDDGVKIGKSTVIDSGYHFGADFYQFCRVGSLPHRFLSLVKPNVWRKLPHWVIWYGTAGTTTRVADATKPLWRRRADRAMPLINSSRFSCSLFLTTKYQQKTQN
jgi:hypothetical protein